MGAITRFLLIAIIVILALIFISRQGTVICFGCEDKDCKCAGYVNDDELCIGVPYACEETPQEQPPATGP